MPRAALPLDKAFWAKVDRRGADECWPWAGSIDSRNTYGRFPVNKVWRRAHRVAYELLVGPIPDGLTLDHLCRNTRCVNPAHLEPCTARENHRRAVAVWRANPTIHVTHAKLSEADVLAIFADARAAKTIADEYGVSKHAVYNVRSGYRWGWLTASQHEARK